MKSKSSSLIFLLLTSVLFHMETLYAQTQKMYVGTYTNQSESKGVYIYDLDEQTGKVELSKTIAMSNPSFLARKGDILYAVNEDNKGMLTAYDLKRDQVLSEISTNGMHPCHVALSPRDPAVIVSNYSSGSLVLYALRDDGSIKSQDDFIAFEGSSINKERQQESHIHSAFFKRDGSRVFVSDLGADLIYVFEIIQKDGKFNLHKVNEIHTKAGGGPRHLVFSKNEKTIYSILELTGEIEVFQQNGDTWVSKQIVPMYAAGFDGDHGGADIKVNKNGKLLYATNRGTANVLATYQITANGLLKSKKIQSVKGDSPRNVNISPGGKLLLISNQNSNNITVLSKDGKISTSIPVPKPVCVIF